jgi:inorganic phosphate transporter, PiT family
MHLLAQMPSFGASMFLVLALALAFGFECVNGFHDTANAVATVIYTHTLRPWMAVVWSGVWNLIGVLTSSGAVAFGIVALLPVELVLNVGSSAGFAMVFALLLAAMIWNVGTWYMGLPASSSHSLIGSIMGVGLANALMSTGHHFGEGVNWAKAREVGMSLLLSPVIGFCASALLLLLLKLLVRKKELYVSPEKDEPPPWYIRVVLFLTCTGVSFAHGSNDGQKGMGLIMLILVGVVPGTYALNMGTNANMIQQIVTASHTLETTFEQHANGATVSAEEAPGALSAYMKSNGKLSDQTFAALAQMNQEIASKLEKARSFLTLPEDDRRSLRTNFYLVSGSVAKLTKNKVINDESFTSTAAKYRSSLDSVTKFIPDWVKLAVAVALGLGTMVGWKRIVVTVGEKIGKSHLTYAQGACAELVAACTIRLADVYGLPVSTTHVLSSGIAGTMAANRSGLQKATLRNILLAWVLTLPACMFLGGGLFAFGLFIIFRIVGLH